MTPPRRSAFYNPHLLSRDELAATFIARQPELERLVEDLRRGGGQHHLLVGVRGSGKTTLLLRLGAAIDEDPRMAKKAIALRFPEEQYNIGRLSDLWLNSLQALAEALETRRMTAEAGRVEAEAERIRGLDEVVRVESGLGALQTWATRHRMLLVLLVDNLDLVLDRLRDHHWSVRKVLGAHRHLVVVGTSSRFLPEAFEYASAFYEFFNVQELGPLDEEEARRVLTCLAEMSGTPDVTRALIDDPGRLKAILRLSGGTPRTLALLHGMLAHGQSTSAEHDLETILDLVTPYYKARFEDLPTQHQLLVDAVALHWHPITAAECADRTGLDINLTSAQLARLVRGGTLEKVDAGTTRHAFQLGERLFNIWYLMRANRRLRRKLFWVAASIQAIYGEDEVQRRVDALLATREGQQAARDPALLLAYATVVTDPAVRRRLELRAICELVERGARAESEMDLAGEDHHLVPIRDRALALKEVRQIASTIRWPRGIDRQAAIDAFAGEWSMTVNRKTRIARAWAATPPALAVVTSEFELPTPRALATLSAAIGRGEVPALTDVTTTTEIDDILALVQSEETLMILDALVAALMGRPLRAASALLDHVLAADARTAFALVAGAGVNANLGLLWSPHVAKAAPLLDTLSFTFARLWSPFVRNGHVAELAEVLEETGTHERALPLYEALRAVADGRAAPLRHLAPELREPTEILLARLLAADDADLVAAPEAARRPASPYDSPQRATTAMAAEKGPGWKTAKGGKAKKKAKAKARRGSG